MWRLFHERSKIAASLTEHLELPKQISFTHGIWASSDKLKSANKIKITLHIENVIERVLHERSNIAGFFSEHREFPGKVSFTHAIWGSSAKLKSSVKIHIPEHLEFT